MAMFIDRWIRIGEASIATPPRVGIQRRGADCSTERLIEASALSSDERVLSTTTFRRIDPC
jgi:hypothetical protein